MKFLAIFLACIVAAQAATSSCPSYSYWCSHNFHVLPSTSYYCYIVPFKKCWCSTQYYADCLTQFPTKKDDSCEDEYDDLDTFISGYESKLLTARETIECELNGGLTPFTNKIDNLHATYLATFKRYLKNCYTEDSTEYTTKVAAYERQLCDARTRALDNFATAVTNTIKKIKAFHDSIIASFKSCLQTRTCRIDSYNTKLDKQAADAKEKYTEWLSDLITKRVEWVEAVLEKFYAGTDKTDSYDAAIEEYESALFIQFDVLTGDFDGKVDAAVLKLKDCYRCNYKCYFNIGCYRFQRKTYTRSCVQFPSPPQSEFKFVGLKAFNVDWKGCAFNCLRTCTDAEKNPTFDEETYNSEIECKASGYKTDLDDKVVIWKKQIADWKSCAETSLSEKITCLLPKKHCGSTPTQAEIDAFQAPLQCQAQSWIDAKEKELTAQVTTIEGRVTCHIDAWKVKALALIGKVKERFNCMVANKCSKVESYKTCLENRRTTQRCRVEVQLNALAEQHNTCYFAPFFQCSFGDLPEKEVFTDLKATYKECVGQKVLDVLDKFDEFWCEWEPKLIEHYECGFKCTTKATTPCLNLRYNWNFCAPSISSCRFYYC